LTKKYNEAISFYEYLEQKIENLKDVNNPFEDRVYLLYEYQEAVKEANNYIEFIKNELDESDIDEQKLVLPTRRPKEDNKETQLMTVIELKDYLKCSKASIYRKTSRKEIPHNKIGNTLYFDKKEIDEWIKSHKRKTIEEIDQEAERYSLTKKPVKKERANYRKK
jgi:excisionase family DNA binding protein